MCFPARPVIGQPVSDVVSLPSLLLYSGRLLSAGSLRPDLPGADFQTYLIMESDLLVENWNIQPLILGFTLTALGRLPM